MGSATAAAAAAESLNQRNILAQETAGDDANPTMANFSATIEEFFTSLLVSPPNAHDDADCDYRSGPLLEAFGGAYGSELDFNRAVFRAVGDCLKALTSQREHSSVFRPALVTAEDKAIVLEPKRRASALVNEKEVEYATGLARDVKMPSDSSCIQTFPATLSGHAWVVFRRPVARGAKEREWKVWLALAAVELKVGTAVCEGISRTSQGAVDGNSLCPLQADKHGPLAQVVLRTVAHVLRGRAALGELPDRIPFAVVSGTKKEKVVDESPHSEANHWVHGNLLVPPVCGARFSFHVDAYGTTVHSDALANNPSVAAYVHVMTHGLAAARRWLDRLADAPHGAALPAPHWISGGAVHFGTGAPLPHVRLAATPVLKYGVHGFRISQGELFEGNVNLRELRSRRTIPNDAVFWLQDDFEDKQQPVLIKVSTVACFNLLISNLGGYLCRIDIRWDPKSAVRKALAQSLHGFFVTQDGNGLIQLLPNLANLGYKPLHPQQWLERDGGWEGLWRAFTGLVNETLIPLALARILHADIRVGYDETFNILYNPTTASMRLIDLDSLCRYTALWMLPDVADRRNVVVDDLPEMMLVPLGYVLGQVICAGEVWLREIGHAVVDANELIEEAVQSGNDVFDAVANEASNAAVDEALVRRVLDHYRNQLETKYSSDDPGSSASDG
jgi:hypothetical protein